MGSLTDLKEKKIIVCVWIWIFFFFLKTSYESGGKKINAIVNYVLDVDVQG